MTKVGDAACPLTPRLGRSLPPGLGTEDRLPNETGLLEKQRWPSPVLATPRRQRVGSGPGTSGSVNQGTKEPRC